METVDLIIPAFNAARTIQAALASALSQTHSPDRIIVVDDGSRDETAALAASLGNRITVLWQPNGGQGSARSLGASASNADLLMFLDADDLLHPQSIALLRGALLRRPECPLAYCRAEAFSDSGDPARSIVALDDPDGDAWPRLIRRNFIRSPGCVLMRRTALIAAGGWDHSRLAQGCEDWDLWLRLAERAPFVRVTDTLLRYRVHPENFSASQEAMDRSYIWVLRKHLKRQHRAAAAALLRGDLPKTAIAVRSALCIWPRSAGWPLRRLFAR